MLWHVFEDIFHGLVVANDILSNRATPCPGISIFVPKCELTSCRVCYNPCSTFSAPVRGTGAGLSAVLTPFLVAPTNVELFDWPLYCQTLCDYPAFSRRKMTLD